ncbi:flavodoxin domain-containing protein [Trujillonella endophytica]|uniref:Menaquinone-dependent protoporphyrinogen oxidase n=1 Tax=Trujillonella endophytica TaxID=673521 RepID=A0A1H8SYF0_9ACTN|nr:flavodoxin domain-containing protein [Trujillella endophytica]SEO83368.1 menaquinone-dependent protoporphyrinogen oxidase [Trujillella endophytica]
MANPGRRVLVASASAGGSTAEVAERIAARLRASLEVEVRPAGPAPAADLDRFDAFVVGSAVHDMAWLPPARELLQLLAPVLGERPVWLFSVAGIDPSGRVRRWLARQEVARIAQGLPRDLRPREHRAFGGVVRMDGVPLWGRLFYRLARQRAGDHRDWAAIESWADDIAAALRPAPAPATSAPAAPDPAPPRPTRRNPC